MPEQPLLLSVKLNFADDSTPEEQEETALQLREELLETDALSVEQATAATAAPTGAKGLPVGVDTLLVTLAGGGSILGTVITTLGGWLSQRHKGSITLKLDGDELTLTNPSAEDHRKLIDAWLARHGSEAA